MTSAEIIAKIRAEIEGREEAILSCPENGIVTLEAKSAIRTMANGLLSFISDIEKSLPAKVADGSAMTKLKSGMAELTEEQMITICRRLEDIAKKYTFKVMSLVISAYRFDDTNVIALYARIHEEDEDCFSQCIYPTLDPDGAEEIVDAFERFLSVEG